MAKKSIKDQIREVLAEDFVGPTAEQGRSQARMAGPFAADYIEGPPGYESPSGAAARYHRPGPKFLLPESGEAWDEPRRPVDDAMLNARREAHPAYGYYGHQYKPPWDIEGSRMWDPSIQQTPLRRADEFYPPPTISAEEQEDIDRRKALLQAITASLKEAVKTENRAAKKKGKK